MYQILGIKNALSLFGLLCAAVIVAWAVLFPPADLSSISGWWKIASGSVSGSALVVGLIGQSPLFPLLCRLPFVRSWLPPINGEWNAELGSNWPVIQQRAQPDRPLMALAPVTADVKIIARLFYIRIDMTSEHRYSISKTVFVRAARDPEDGSVTLHYLYRNSTRLPEATDSSSHEGAACLTVESSGRNVTLEGVYWTNRNWHLGLNTAGTITLRPT